MGSIKTKKVDLTIVGCGILGLMLAYRTRLLDQSTKILLIDQNYPGAGATLKAAALASNVAKKGDTRRVSDKSAAFYQHLWEGNKDLFFHLPIYYHSFDLETFSQKLGTNWRKVNTASSHSQFPIWLKPLQTNLVYQKAVHYYPPERMIQYLIQQLQEDDLVSFVYPIKVKSLRSKSGEIEVLTDSRELYYSQRVAICTGAWKFPDFELPMIRNKKIVSFLIKKPCSETSPVFYFDHDAAFLLPQKDKNQWLLSVTSQEWNVDPDRTSWTFSNEDWALGLSFIRKYLNIQEKDLQEGQVFCDAYTADKLPVLVPHQELQEVVYLGGSSGRGLRFAPEMAQMAIDYFQSLQN